MFVEKSRAVTTHTDVYDLEDTHTPAQPRVRRIKAPHLHDPAYGALVRHPRIIEVLCDLWGPNIRFDTAKLNLKSAGYGAAVEWHQDWAFYPHTNDDLAAVGVMMDDMELANGPLMIIPGTPQGAGVRPSRRRKVLRRHGSGAQRLRLREGDPADRPRRARSRFTTCAPCTARR